ncbi:hypothetical protein HAZT_HAZT003106 [Hyalella azteca]|uniref:Uncharacterized protein n=1 Tax=Hyalella azteca TaxID=294128 RepID=A0A6A0H8L7_HYAAZ|nr:hypothetical protein HAZT_HAZT003106 [Hyalella azteca]
MSSVDLLLYRPWSDTTKKAQEEPVDFSSRGKRSVEPEADLGYTEIDSQLPGALKLPDINNKATAVHDGSKQDSDNDEEEDEEAARESDNDLSSDRKRAEMPFEENKNRDGREGVIWESSKSSSHLVSVPETSPYHLFPPTLYWPHGSTPLGNQLAKPINRPFSSTAVIDHPLYKALPPPVSGDTRAASFSPDKKSKSPKKTKASRRLNFDEDKSSPVSGTIIRELGEGEAPLVVRKGDIDPAYNVVEVTEEAKAEIAKIENKIGDYRSSKDLRIMISTGLQSSQEVIKSVYEQYDYWSDVLRTSC